MAPLSVRGKRAPPYTQGRHWPQVLENRTVKNTDFKMAGSFSKRYQNRTVGLRVCSARALCEKPPGCASADWRMPDVRGAWLCGLPRAPLESPQSYDAPRHQSDYCGEYLESPQKSDWRLEASYL